MLKLGVQVSIQGGVDKAPLRAEELDCNAFQCFSRNPREWRRPKLDREEVSLFKRGIKEKAMCPVVIHAPYTCNLASPDKHLFKNSMRAFIKDVKDANVLGAHYFVFHMGSHSKTSELEGLERIARALKKTLQKVNTKTVLLMENTSGNGSWLGYKFWQHSFILKELKWSNKIGVCIDTCHCYAAGYDVASKEGLKKMFTEIDKYVGIERLKLVHLNDSMDPLDSRKDRHQHIGDGHIGREGFRNILRHPIIRNLPLILETPKKSIEDDLKNLETVRRLYYGI